ncbi:DMT family transporter [Noviherbaspirillum autotrophicum]|uniref:Multidrug DMT transporter permease n=1 Tax=Noviherbaspirillum autotrophicum TaxID=709839 RepID=A0A0C2BSG6_9BURK|nr:DMT family transporter [Noviherbaspirillum autotrophicum]KIF82984.1 multidrug DMT transporter permease [Noviherbaspirillum autotrophicum]
MSPADLAKLVFLSAIWGGSFIFLRVAVPEVGPLLTAMLRTSLAGVALMLFATATGVTMNWRANLKPFAVVGLFAGVLPFTCFSFAALHLPAAYSAVLNATAPLFGAVFSALWLAERLTARKIAGLLLGVAGVAILVGAGTLAATPATLISIAACLLAAASYAVSSIIVKKTGMPGGIHPIAMATGSLVLGGLMMLPTAPFALPKAMPSLLALGCITGLSLLSSGLAQALFIPLIVKVGPTRAMCVSFLIPLFSMLWGAFFLHEAVRAGTLVGGAVVLLAMALVLPAAHSAPAKAIAGE